MRFCHLGWEEITLRTNCGKVAIFCIQAVLFKTLHADGLAIVVATHNLALAAMANRHLEIIDAKVRTLTKAQVAERPLEFGHFGRSSIISVGLVCGSDPVHTHERL